MIQATAVGEVQLLLYFVYFVSALRILLHMYLCICVLMIQATAVGEVQLLLAYCAPPPVLCDTYDTTVQCSSAPGNCVSAIFILCFSFGVLSYISTVL